MFSKPIAQKTKLTLFRLARVSVVLHPESGVESAGKMLKKKRHRRSRMRQERGKRERVSRNSPKRLGRAASFKSSRKRWIAQIGIVKG